MEKKKKEMENWRDIEDKNQEIKEREWDQMKIDEEQWKERRNRERREDCDIEIRSKEWRESVKREEDESIEDYVARIEQTTMLNLVALMKRTTSVKEAGRDEWKEKQRKEVQYKTRCDDLKRIE